MILSSSDVFHAAVEALTPRYGLGEAQSIAQILLEDAFGHPKISDQGMLNESQIQLFQDHYLPRLTQGEPIQYVLGMADFFGLKFEVSPGVLIPRQETEELVDQVLQIQKKYPRPNPQILDIGTGSGCIAVSIQKKWKTAKVSALDLSEAALSIAQSNAARHQVSIDFSQVDILNKAEWSQFPDSSFDIIVSNPPYIGQSESADMPDYVTAWEPHLALFVPDQDLYIFYKAIADFAREKLRSGGYLLFEINEFKASGVVSILQDLGFVSIALLPDLSGADRMVVGRIQ
jgi:release factor glutamine methyltransferase